MKIYYEVNEFLEICFRKIEENCPRPNIVKIGEIKQLRYIEKGIETAIVQKLARFISSLNAGLLLLEQAYTQEVGVIFRTLDELQEDITFLLIPLINKTKISDIHEKYLECFYQEELDV